MSKPLIGMILGAVLGLVDGISSYFYPEVRNVIMTIVFFSTLKGLLTGFVAGMVARKWNSLPLGIASGLIVGLLLAYLVSPPPDAAGNHYYFEIIMPGSILGVIVGFATQRFGTKSYQHIQNQGSASFQQIPR